MLTAILWVTVLGPALHLIDHRNDHVHAHGAAGPHRHADPQAPQPGDDGPSPAHGADAADHFGLVLLTAAPATPPLPVCLVAPARAPVAPKAPQLPALASPRLTRGPPASAAHTLG